MRKQIWACANECWHFSPDASWRFSVWSSRCLVLHSPCISEGRWQRDSFCFLHFRPAEWFLCKHVLLRCCCHSNTTETFILQSVFKCIFAKKSIFSPLLAPNYNQAQSVLGRLSTNKVLVSRFDDSNLAWCTDEQKVFLKCLTFCKPSNINLNQCIVLLKRKTNMIVGLNSNYSNVLQQNLFWSKKTFGMSAPSACVCVFFPFL